MNFLILATFLSFTAEPNVAADDISRWTFDWNTKESSINVRSTQCRRNKGEGSQVTFTWTVPEINQSKDQKRVARANRSSFFKKASLTCGCSYALVINDKYELSGKKLPELMQGNLPKEIKNFTCKVPSKDND